MIKKYLWVILAAILLGIQLIRPDFKNPASDPAQDFKAIAKPPVEVAAILDAACYDCHSNQTRYPWYSQIAPVSWWLANHVREGREHVNFSTYGAYGPGDQAEILEESAEVVSKGEMPLKSYTWTHGAARLSDAQRKQLADWFNSISESAPAAPDRGGREGHSETE